jgi:hypothetical protein
MEQSSLDLAGGRKTKKRPRVVKRTATRDARPAADAKRAEGKRTWLSATGIETLQRCPRCFWRQYNEGIRQPEGIVSRLANRFDGVIKQYFDLYRTTGELPPLIGGKVTGKLESPFQEKYFLNLDAHYGVFGKLDECLVDAEGRHSPFDHKTSSSDPRGKDLIPAYQTQLDTYAMLLESNRKPTSGKGHLLYFFPDHGDRLHEGFPMVIHLVTLPTDPDRAKKKFEHAIGVLEGPKPDSSPECPFCAWAQHITKE